MKSLTWSNNFFLMLAMLALAYSHVMNSEVSYFSLWVSRYLSASIDVSVVIFGPITCLITDEILIYM